MGFERAVLKGQVEHDLLIAIRKPKKGKQRRALVTLVRPRHMCSQVHARKSHSAFFTALSHGHGLDAYLHILPHKDSHLEYSFTALPHTQTFSLQDKCFMFFDFLWNQIRLFLQHILLKNCRSLNVFNNSTFRQIILIGR